MAGLCENCGKAVEELITCEQCGGRVCPDCKTSQGCKLCIGGMRVE